MSTSPTPPPAPTPASAPAPASTSTSTPRFTPKCFIGGAAIFLATAGLLFGGYYIGSRGSKPAVSQPGVSAPTPEIAVGQMLDGSYRLLQGNGVKHIEKTVPYHPNTPNLYNQINEDINEGNFRIMVNPSGKQFAARKQDGEVPFYREAQIDNPNVNARLGKLEEAVQDLKER